MDNFFYSVQDTLKNVRGGRKYAVALAGDMRDIVMYGIECFDGAKMLLDERVKN